MGNSYLAIDIGASSGRCILGRLEGGRMVLEEVHRFENRQLRRGGHDCWDIDRLWQGILDGLKACKVRGAVPATVGIDTWAVDFVLLDKDGRMAGDAVAYRDSRTDGVPEQAERLVDPAQLYARTGIQKQNFNTLYQLLALKQEHPEQLAAAESLLMIPDYFGYLLTGVKKQEYTNATSTNLVNAADKTWDRELIRAYGLPDKLFGELSAPGTAVGRLRPEIAAEVGFDATVILPATHDTGSAFLAVPARDDEAVYLSSGTWSLLGVENPQPITSEASRAQNFTNEGGAWYRYRYLKNIMGLWMIQSVRRELNGADYVAGKARAPWQLDVKAGERQWSFPDLIAAAEAAADFDAVVDANDPAFLAPDSMIAAVQSACAAAGQPVPRTVGQLMQCVYRSLTVCYRDAIRGLEKLTGKKYTSINIVGGGCQDMYLNRMTARTTGLPVWAGPVEGTAIGNLMVQMIAAGELKDLADARACVRSSFDIREIPAV
ncbi:MAG TPA: rhamnulokinase [Candidatus Faecalibacterium faecipullorum]|uniref:Rhamnulokinase n=1 Tax=Candidatus Faecalibacterium faecipullorum TaxID=2838578 RepID=A0A9D2S829_9FIRM|nr:rhamnulokinase [Candidatus Faecalibacterium faecipullorum]